MAKNKGLLLGIIAIIIGASGLGLGIFSFLNFQVVEGPKGIQYPVSSEAEIKDALDAIGTGYGIITITNNLTLDGKIDINGGGNYVIQGAGAVIKCASTLSAFNITNARSLTIQNIKIDTTQVTKADLGIIRINEANNNTIYLRNVHIIGDDNRMGYGLIVLSDNVWVSECYFYKVSTGIWQLTGNNAHIYNNFSDDLGHGGIILSYTNNTFVEGNFINNTGACGIATRFDSFYNIISNNIISFFNESGIEIGGLVLGPTGYNIIVGNYIQYDNDDDTDCAGIYVNGDYNIIDSNGCYNIDAPSSYKGYGINIAGGTNNTVVGNTCLFNDLPFSDAGATDTYISGNQFY